MTIRISSRLKQAVKATPPSDGHWLYLDGGTPHSIRGIQDATLLLTILFSHQDRTIVGQITCSQDRNPTVTAS
jgi:hypothetical protein